MAKNGGNKVINRKKEHNGAGIFTILVIQRMLQLFY
jgi:hypothetical protein